MTEQLALPEIEVAIVNLTPHLVTVFDEDDPAVRYNFQSQGVARARERSVPLRRVNGFSVVKTTYEEPIDLPSFTGDTFYIVSRITAEAARANGRVTTDLLLTSDVVRDADGQIIGCRKFAQL